MSVSFEQRGQAQHIVAAEIVTFAADPVTATTLPPATMTFLNIAQLGSRLSRGGMSLVAKGTGLPYLNAFRLQNAAQGDLDALFAISGKLDASAEMAMIIRIMAAGVMEIGQIVLNSEPAGSARDVDFTFPAKFTLVARPVFVDFEVLGETDSGNAIVFSPGFGRTSIEKVDQ